jgi:diguanylate cyclase (GGDEF)-like protein
MLLGRACAASMLVSSAKERQIRLERGYLARIRELRRLTATVDLLSEIRDDFMAVLSHDLRAPLAIIQGNCQILGEGLVGDMNQRQLKSVSTVVRQATRMTEMVEDLLDRFRAGSTPTPNQSEPISLGEIARQVCTSHRDGAHERQIALEVLEPQPCHALVDPSVLRQVLGNLVDNAIKHSPSAATVTLSVFSRGPEVGIEVRDRGPGFEDGGPNLTGPVAPREHGMGLKLCDRMIRRSGGALEFANHPEGGAVTCVVLPQTSGDSRGLRILVGSGELDRLEALTERLGVRWDVTGLTDGESLLEHVRQSPPDVLVLDQTLQGRMSGIDLLVALKADSELGSVPVVMIVPGGQPALVEQGHTLGALAVLRLPLNHEELEAQVGRAVRLSGESGNGFSDRSQDALTGLDMVKSQEGRLRRLQTESQEAGLPLPAQVVDIDQLKEINNKHGYAAGDQVILWLSVHLRRRARPGELLVRLRSDEFLLVSPRASLEATQRAAADLARSVKEARPRIGVARLRVGVCVRVVDLSNLESFEELHYAGPALSGSKKDLDGA